MPKPVYYSEYLQLDKVLGAQQLKSELAGTPAHDEMLFIVTHQTYELWFKQIVHELESIVDIFDDPVVEHKNMGVVIHRLARICLLYTSPSPRDGLLSRMPSSA